MRLYVVTATDGQVIGTARPVPADPQHPEAPSGGHPVASPGQAVYELDVADELTNIESVEEFHNAVADALRRHLAGK